MTENMFKVYCYNVAAVKTFNITHIKNVNLCRQNKRRTSTLATDINMQTNLTFNIIQLFKTQKQC